MCLALKQLQIIKGHKVLQGTKPQGLPPEA